MVGRVVVIHSSACCFLNYQENVYFRCLLLLGRVWWLFQFSRHVVVVVVGEGGGGGRRGLLEEGCLIEKRRCLIKIPISFTSRSCHLGLKL